jgi:malonate decarboxylase epsilon subunit
VAGVILFSFPGQGSQSADMLHKLPVHTTIRNTMQEAADVLGYDPLILDAKRALQSTVAVQLCLLIAGVAMARFFIAQDARPRMVAGLSIGAFPAAVTAGILEFSDALRLVARRGQLMEASYPHGYGMLAVLGLSRQVLEYQIARVHTPQTPVYLANINSERQYVLAGAESALAHAAALATAAGATRCERLEIAVPSHCPLLDEAAQRMRLALNDVHLRRPEMIYLSSSKARAMLKPEAIAEDLATNMAQQVQWHDTARLAWELGARFALEMPARAVLTGLMTPIFGAENLANCASYRADTLLGLLHKYQKDQ